MAWWDFFKTFKYAFKKDPLAQKINQAQTGAGITQPDAIPDIRAASDGTWGAGGAIRLRDTNDFIDLSTVTNRIHRYREYERLRNIAEIETAMTVFADETCVSGNTLVATLQGYRKIKELAEQEKDRFLVYCYDFDKMDYTLGWAHSPRKTKTAKTIRIILSDGKTFTCTPDHRILLRNEEWICAGDLKVGDLLMPFYKLDARQHLTKNKYNQFPRIWTHSKGWIHERQFIDEWKLGKNIDKYEELNKTIEIISHGTIPHNAKNVLSAHGFSLQEIKWLLNKPDFVRVIGIHSHTEMDVYDLTVDEYHNFATDWGIVHNCQKDEDGRVFKIHCKNQEVKEELEYLFFSKKMLNFDQKKMWDIAKRLFIYGDFFFEIVINPENPKDGILNLVPLPPDSMYRIETTKGKLIEFQQSREGPDYQSLARVEVTQATDADLQQATAIRFTPEQIIHIRIGDDRKTFYPYGVSLIEAARGPAHQLRLMEDAMVVYRLTRAPERRVFYIDTFNLPPHKAEAFVERMKDKFKKKKVSSMRTSAGGASAVEERWHAPAADEDYWIPVRPNSNTRVETLPGACLDLKTKITLLDGKSYTLQELIHKWEKGETLWTVSCNPHTGELAPGLITWAGITKRKAQVVKIKLSNGKEIICTPDHKFPVFGKGFVKAEQLTSKDKIITFTKFHDKANNIKIYDNFYKEWKRIEEIVFCFVKNNIDNLTRKPCYAKISTNNFATNLCETSQENIHFSMSLICVGLHKEKYKKNIEKLICSFIEPNPCYVVSVEMLDERMDVGTITIDGNEQFHNYHTFALEAGIFTKNSNLGEIDDTVYFRNKLFTALNFPRNYFNNEDPQSTRISLSAQDIKFARMIERLQSHIEDALCEIAYRHLKLLGYPEEEYEDLEIRMTPPSDWRELTRAEVISNRLNNASTLKGSQLMSDYDILTKWMKYPDEEAKKMLARLKIQKLEELKMQIISQNPQLLGVGLPGPEEGEEEISTEPTGQNPMLGGGPESTPPQQATGMEQPGMEPMGGPSPEAKFMDSGEQEQERGDNQGGGGLNMLPEPTEEDIRRFHLEIEDYEREMDEEEYDASELGE